MQHSQQIGLSYKYIVCILYLVYTNGMATFSLLIYRKIFKPRSFLWLDFDNFYYKIYPSIFYNNVHVTHYYTVIVFFYPL